MNQQTRQRPEDQYVMPVEASRRGAHRARVSPLLGALPFVAVAVVVVGVVLLAWTLFGGNGGGTTATEPAGGVSSAASQPASTGKPAASSGAQQPSATKSQPAPTKSSTPVKSTPAASRVDKTLKIVVRNSTSTKGLAAGAADKLKAQGWTINGIPDNYKPTISSTVFYNDPSQKASAQAVAKILGIDLVKPDPATAVKGVTVILGPDYQA